jgi:GNAT superfamily N-acetyltransferase
LTPDSIEPESAFDRLIDAVAHLYRYQAAQRPIRGALHHIQYEQPAFDIRITDEFFVLDADPDEVLQAVGAARIHEHHCLTVFHRSALSLSKTYLEYGYRHAERLFLMSRDLDSPAMRRSGLVARRASTPPEAAWINERRGKPIVTPRHLSDPAIAHYYLMIGETLAATGVLACANQQVAYVADMFTFPAYRDQGCATALIEQMLADAMAAGATQSLLLATEQARRLYAKLGYTNVLVAQVFVPM